MLTINLAHLLGRGVRLEPHEAVAVAQGVVASGGAAVPENVELSGDGSIACICAAEGVMAAEVAAFLHRLLPPDTRVPAPLRYSIARALGQVEAPPFQSVVAFSTALRRFETGPRADVVRSLLQRVARVSRPAAPAPAPVPARTPVPAPAAAAIIAPRPIHRAPARAPRTALFVLLAFAASAAAGFMFVRAAGLRQAHVTTQAAPPQAATESLSPAPVSAPRPDRAVASTGRTESLQPVVRARAFSPAFSPDGTSMFFQTGEPRDSRSAIAIASLTGSPDGRASIRTIVDEGSRNYHARPSPDGRLIAFDSDRDGERGVYVADPDGANARRISGPGYAALPAWSPDGSRIAHIRAEAGRPSVWNLWVQPLDGGARRITRYPYGQTWSASWFPDNRRICYTHEDTLMVVDLVTGRWRRFRSPVAGALVRTPAVSPDGSQVVFQVFRDGAWILDLADGTMARVLADPTAEEFAWAPDGASIAFHSKRNGQWGIYLLSRG